jgi:membrane associated rhomboid family serine protease
VFPVKDNMPQPRVPLVTLVLIAATVAASVAAGDEGILYVAANALALWLFGPGVEDALGRLRFAGFALAGAGAAALAQVAIDADGVALAATAGAVAVTAGGRLVLFPRRTVLTVSVIPFFFGVVEVPSVVYLALWCALQVVAGPGAALLAAFVLGLLLARPLAAPESGRGATPPGLPAV